MRSVASLQSFWRERLIPDFKQVKQIFLDAVERSDPAEREAYLRQACGEDAALRRRVDALLRRHDEPGDVLEPPRGLEVGLPHTLPLPLDAAGMQLGPYKLLQKIGEGGMGAVWMAEQREPVRRLVAVKVIRAGLDSGQAVGRFEAERQTLALMNHPNIAQIHDGGTTADGRPYLVMELVKGTPITAYCDEHRLSLRQRLELFIPVCQALQHAHQKGVIHRDIKPSNVLIAPYDGRPVVKVIDFGVSKAAGQRLTDRTLFTEFGALIGTLEYMSPEQAELNNQDIDTRSDVYSLGVLLYELLTGSTPLTAERRKASSLFEVLRTIREDEPPRPSSRLSHSSEALPRISAQRQSDPVKLRKQLRAELDWIVMKALEKDRTRRYDTANALALDIERYLNDESVEACPPSASYRLRKFLRRYRGPVVAAAGILTALVLGLLGTMNFAAGEAQQRRRAEQNARAAEDEKNAALYQAYRAYLAAAGAALQSHDVADAGRQLEAAPEALRDWEWRHLRSRLDDRSGRISAEPGGAFFLLNRDHTTQIGQLQTNGTFRLTNLEGQTIRDIRFAVKDAPNANLLQAGGRLRLLDWPEGGRLRIWDESDAGRFRLTLRYVCDLSADGARLALPGPTRLAGQVGLALYDTSTGQQTAVGAGHKTLIWATAFSPDGARVASGDDSGMVFVWNAETGARIAACLGHTSKVLGLAFRHDGARLVTTSADSTVRQWDPATGAAVEPPFDRHSGEVLTAAYSPDGTRIVSGGTDRTVRVWAASGRQELSVLHGHTGAVTQVAFTPEGQRVLSLSQDRGLSWATDNTVGIWDAASRAGLPVLRGHTSYVYPVAFSPDGRWIASGSWDHTVRLWDAATGEPCATLPQPGIVRALAFSPDSRWFVTGAEEENQLRICDVATGRVRRVFPGPGPSIRFLQVSPDGARIAASTFDRDAGSSWGVYDATSGKPLFTAQGAGLAFSPNGRWIVARGANDTTARLLDASTHEALTQLTGLDATINTAAFSPDSRWLALGARDGTIRVWDLAIGSFRVFRGHTDEVFSLAFHPGGRRLASAGRDRVVWLWDLARGEEVARLQGHTSYIWSLAFSPDGSTLASGSGDGTVRLWDTAPLAVRYRIRHEAEALQPEADRRVDQLFRQQSDADAVVAAIRTDPTLTDPQRDAALRAVLRRQNP